MGSQVKIIRRWNDVALIEEKIYVLSPYLTIETAYLITSCRILGGEYFNTLQSASKKFEAEAMKSGGCFAET